MAPRPIAQGPQADAQRERLRPFVEVVFLVVAADGVLHEAERSALRGTVRLLTGGVFATAAADALTQELQAALARDGLDIRLDHVAAELASNPEDVELAMSLALAAAGAGGGLSGAAQAVVEALIERFGLPAARLRAIEDGRK